MPLFLKTICLHVPVQVHRNQLINQAQECRAIFFYSEQDALACLQVQKRPTITQPPKCRAFLFYLQEDALVETN